MAAKRNPAPQAAGRALDCVKLASKNDPSDTPHFEAVQAGANKRPSPELLKVQHAEIVRRYDAKRKYRHRTKAQIMRSVRISELNRLFEARYGEQLPNNAKGRRMVTIAAGHLDPKRLKAWCSLRAPWLIEAEMETTRAQVEAKPRAWRADTLARLLNLTYAERQAQRITTIGAIDCDKAARARLRKNKDKSRKQAQRYERAPDDLNSIDTRSAAAVRQARYRERKRNA